MQNLLRTLHGGLFFSSPQDLGHGREANNFYDPELVYVECRLCGNPIMWEPGRTTALLLRSQINPKTMDAHCLILSEGCTRCLPDAHEYPLSIVRLSDITPQEIISMRKPCGHA